MCCNITDYEGWQDSSMNQDIACRHTVTLRSSGNSHLVHFLPNHNLVWGCLDFISHSDVQITLDINFIMSKYFQIRATPVTSFIPEFFHHIL